MMFSTIPPFCGFLMMALLPNEPEYKWVKWGGYFMTVPFVISLFLAWTLIPSNTAGRTKRTLTSSFTFVGYCVGNMTGSQIFKTEDAVRRTVTPSPQTSTTNVIKAKIYTWHYHLRCMFWSAVSTHTKLAYALCLKEQTPGPETCGGRNFRGRKNQAWKGHGRARLY